MMCTLGDEKWGDLELLQRKAGRWILGCDNRLPNEAITGELGWLSLHARRVFLALSFWGKILAMPKDRWVRRVYEQSRRTHEARPHVKNWAQIVHLWLRNIGLEDHWIRQDTGDAWKTTARAAVELADQRSWRAGSAGKSKLRDYRRWKALPGWERYLDSRDEQGRRRLTKARGGILEVSEETGRWERISVQGKQVPVPRHLRWCEQCLIETEDLRHLLLVCPGYRKVRAEFFGQVAKAHPGLRAGRRALVDLASIHGSIGRHDVDSADGEALLDWMMSGKGQEATTRLLTELWLQRKELRLEDVEPRCDS